MNAVSFTYTPLWQVKGVVQDAKSDPHASITSPAVIPTRTQNAANGLSQSILRGGSSVPVAYDDAGNRKVRPARIGGVGRVYVHDAWNRCRDLGVRGAGALSKITDGSGRSRFWQPGGGFDRAVRNIDELVREANYVHRNPVERRLAACETGWRWSSPHEYVKLRTVAPKYAWRSIASASERTPVPTTRSRSTAWTSRSSRWARSESTERRAPSCLCANRGA